MIEKVGSKHPDKIADRIAGTIVDECYKRKVNAYVSVDAVVENEKCYIFFKSNVDLGKKKLVNLASKISKFKKIIIEYSLCKKEVN